MVALCKGICEKHGKPCLATTDPKALRMAEKATLKLCGNRIKNVVKNGVLNHRHVCEDCLDEASKGKLS